MHQETKFAAISPGERLAIARREAGFLKAKNASDAFGWNYKTYSGHEAGHRGLRDDSAQKYAAAFGVRVEWLKFGTGSMKGSGSAAVPVDVLGFGEPPAHFLPGAPIYGTRDLGDGLMSLEKDAPPVEHHTPPDALASVRNVYGIYVVEPSMYPRFKNGEIAWVHPTRPPREGDDVTLEEYEDQTPTGRACVRELVRMTPNTLTVRTFNPPAEVDLPREHWDVKLVAPR